MNDTYNDGYKTEDIKCIIVDFIAEDGKGGYPIMRQGTYVLCKDCKYCEDESYTDEDTGKEVKYLVCDRWYEQDDADGNMFPKADDFCSKGERK